MRGLVYLKKLTLAAMLAAMSVVIAMFCKNALNFADGLFRITFENLPIILSGMLLGPVYGGAVGLICDLLGYLLSGQTYPPNPIVTLGAVAVGIISGVIARYVIKKRGSIQTVVCCGAAHLFGSMIIKTIGLFAIYGWAVLVRIPIYIVICAVEALLLCLLFRSSGFSRLVEGVDK